MTDGLDAVREVATHWRRRYQAAQAIIEQLQYDLTRTIEERDMALGDNDERDDYKRLYENKRDQHKAMLREFWQMSNKRDETQRELDTAKDALFVVTSIKNRALDERDSFKFQRDELDKLFYRVVDQRADSRRWSAAWKRAAVRYRHGLRNLDPRIARLERITGGGVAPIQGVEDMYFTGESWQTEDE